MGNARFPNNHDAIGPDAMTIMCDAEIRRRPKRLQKKGGALALCLCVLPVAAVLTGCGSTIADLPSPIGLPEGVPARPAVAPETPPVNEMPPARSLKLLTPDELKKAQADLTNVQESQARRANRPSQPAAKPAAAKPLAPKSAKDKKKPDQAP